MDAGDHPHLADRPQHRHPVNPQPLLGRVVIQEADRPYLLAALLWIILFFAATSGLSRVFVKEDELPWLIPVHDRTVDAEYVERFKKFLKDRDEF